MVRSRREGVPVGNAGYRPLNVHQRGEYITVALLIVVGVAEGELPVRVAGGVVATVTNAARSLRPAACEA